MMEFARNRGKSWKLFVTCIMCIFFLYVLFWFKTFSRGPAPTGMPMVAGEPVDWRHLPPKPQFPKHTPLPLPTYTPAFTAKNHSAEFSFPTDEVSMDRLYRQLQIVTAFSENHYKEALGLIGTVQKEMPDKKILVYDIGMEAGTLIQVNRLCRVELRKFSFEKYPPHVRNLHTYAWKVIIINETLNEFGAIFWADSSIRFKTSLRHLVPYATRHHGYTTHFHSFDPRGTQDTPRGHIYYFTHPKMFSALGIKRTDYYSSKNATPHASANRQIFVRNTYLQEKLVNPLFQCALNPACISPQGARLGKHRFDASALSLLLYKNMRFEWGAENNDNKIFDEAVDIRRTVIDWHLAKQCP